MYYYNDATGEITWNVPEPLGWEARELSTADAAHMSHQVLRQRAQTMPPMQHDEL